MAHIRANLHDEAMEPVVAIEVARDETYHVNDYFRTDDGGLYLVAEVKPGQPPVDVGLDGIWLDGHSSRVAQATFLNSLSSSPLWWRPIA